MGDGVKHVEPLNCDARIIQNNGHHADAKRQVHQKVMPQFNAGVSAPDEDARIGSMTARSQRPMFGRPQARRSNCEEAIRAPKRHKTEKTVSSVWS